MELYGLPLLESLAALSLDSRAEVRQRAVGVLFELLSVHAGPLTPSFWRRVTHRVLLPLFDLDHAAAATAASPAGADSAQVRRPYPNPIPISNPSPFLLALHHPRRRRLRSFTGWRGQRTGSTAPQLHHPTACVS
jgi:hypothetical protein